MTKRILSSWLAIMTSLVVLNGCSGPTEDVRVTFCKGLAEALQPGLDSIEWTGNENTFRRPEYAIAGLTFEAVDRAGSRRSGRAACYYAYEALDDTALNLAQPFDAYETLPFRMTFDDRTLSDAELLQLVNEEQRRLGRQVVDSLHKGARDVADKVREGLGQ